ncbi:LOW QUALITY PROTEIN: Iron-sulfur protein, partial [Streptomyces filamentosus NRRL 15998]
MAAGAAGAAALATGCGSSDGDGGGDASPAPSAPGDATGGAELARTGDVPVGGGTIFKRAEGGGDAADGGRVQGVLRRLHPSELSRLDGARRHHQLPVPRQQIQHHGRGGRGRPGDPAAARRADQRLGRGDPAGL